MNSKLLIPGEKTLYELFIKCPKTGLATKIAGPYYKKQLIEEEKVMYEKHYPPSFATFVIVKRDPILNPLLFNEKMGADEEKHNPFNSDFIPKITKTVIPKDPDDPRDLPWVITVHSDEKEKGWVEDRVSDASVAIYKQHPNIITPCHSLYGTLWHYGFVRHLIDFHTCSYKQKVFKWIEEIGNHYVPTKITGLRGGSWTDGIYVGGFFTCDVKNLSEYCERMFGIDKFEIAKLFELRDPTKIIIPEDTSKKASTETLIAGIYAEMGDIESARRYYSQSVETLEGKRWQSNFVDKFAKFEKYVAANETSILSSHF